MKKPTIRLWGLMILIACLAGLLAWDRRVTRTIYRPDLIVVEVESALPGHPIRGERLVRPDGKIRLGTYGDLAVDGLTIDEAKAKIVEHLRTYLSDEDLGLVERTQDRQGQWAERRIAPSQTDRVSVWIDTKNSKPGLLQQSIQTIRIR